MRPNQQNNNSNNNNNKNRSRGRNGGRKPINPLSRNYESNGPDVKVRGNAAHITEKYQQLARDAHASGDSVMAENYLQHAEHYFRIVSAAQPQGQPRQDQYGQDIDEEFDNDDMSDGNNRFAMPDRQMQQNGGNSYNDDADGNDNQQSAPQQNQNSGFAPASDGGEGNGNSNGQQGNGQQGNGQGAQQRRLRERPRRERPPQFAPQSFVPQAIAPSADAGQQATPVDGNVAQQVEAQAAPVQADVTVEAPVVAERKVPNPRGRPKAPVVAAVVAEVQAAPAENAGTDDAAAPVAAEEGERKLRVRRPRRRPTAEAGGADQANAPQPDIGDLPAFITGGTTPAE